jgi:hypothetical protein
VLDIADLWQPNCEQEKSMWNELRWRTSTARPMRKSTGSVWALLVETMELLANTVESRIALRCSVGRRRIV